MDKIAVVRVRGIRNMKPELIKGLEMLRLNRPHHCVVVDNTPQNLGMLQKVKDYIAYGQIKEETLKLLIEKRGEKGQNRVKDADKVLSEIQSGKKLSEFIDPVFRLHPPRKGYKDIKRPYPQGALGKRPDMDNLIKRMA